MKFSIAVPTRNRTPLLESCLSAIRRLAVPDDVSIEVLVCDNGSSDATAAVVESFRRSLPIRYLREDRIGKSFALARIIAEASGDWLLCLDDDVAPRSEWLAAYLEAIGRYPGATFFGGQILASEDARFTGVKRCFVDAAPWVHGIVACGEDRQFQRDSHPSLAGANSAFLRNALLDARVPDRLVDLARSGIVGQDAWLMLDQIGRGNTGWFLTAAQVTIQIPPDKAGPLWFWKWYFSRGLDAARMSAATHDRSIPQWLAARRRKMILDALRENRLGEAILALVAGLALLAGYASVDGV